MNAEDAVTVLFNIKVYALINWIVYVFFGVFFNTSGNISCIYVCLCHLFSKHSEDRNLVYLAPHCIPDVNST